MKSSIGGVVKPKVYSRRKDAKPPAPEGAVYVGRPSIWGNPFREGVHGTHEEVIKLYHQWLKDPDQTKLVRAMKNELQGCDLVCWCKPEPCHGDIILKVANGKRW